MNGLLWNPSLWRPCEEKLRARISLAWTKFSTDFSKLYSINRSWGCKYLSNPIFVTFSQVFTRTLWLSRKSGASCGWVFLLLYIQPVMPEGARVRDILCHKHFGLNTPHFKPLFAMKSAWVWNSFCTRSSVSADHNQAVMPFLLNLFFMTFSIFHSVLCLSHLCKSVMYLRRKTQTLQAMLHFVEV